MAELTQDRLKELFDYNEDTGDLIRRVRTNGRVRVGEVAGSKNVRGYLQTQIDGKKYYAHRLIWFIVNGTWPQKHIDHINGIKNDNRISNLRDVSCGENSRNLGKRCSNKSGFIGVYFSKQREKWVAQIRVNGIAKHLGLFKCKLRAVWEYNKAKIKYGYHPNHGR